MSQSIRNKIPGTICQPIFNIRKIWRTPRVVDPSTLTVYAVGRIVLWTTKRDTVNLDRGIDILRDRSVARKIAIANPEHAPYGRAAKAILEHVGIWAEVQP
jgi:molybdate transport system substrate-binding protein